MRRASLLFALGVLLAAVTVTDMSDAAPRTAKRSRPTKIAKPKPLKSAKARRATKAPARLGPEFNREAAAAVLAAVDLGKCRATNAARGEGHVVVTFAPTGLATTARVDRGPMARSPVAKCIAARYRTARVPAFDGPPVQVGKSFRFD